jgi:hypothetical protein
MKFYKNYKWEIYWGIGLIIFSFIMYFIQAMIFNDARLLFQELLAQLAYLPLYVFLNTIVIEQLLKRKEKADMVRKINTVIGVFFSEIGKELIGEFTKFDLNFNNIKGEFTNDLEWTQERIIKLRGSLKKYKSKIDSRNGDLLKIKMIVDGKRQLLINFLNNPNLLEHQVFTELLFAIFHISEEITQRGEFKNLNKEDYDHLSNDIKRIYILIIFQWISYMEHLSKEYPYLYSMALKTNPFVVS